MSRHIQHVVTEIVAPWGLTIDERPPIPSAEERIAFKAEKKRKKLERRGRLPNGVREGSRETRSVAQGPVSDSTEREAEDDSAEDMVGGTQVAS